MEDTLGVTIKDVKKYVEKNIGQFHKKRLDNLADLKLSKILKRKNPYLFKAKNILKAQDLVTSLLDAHLSSQEESIFGDFLEGLAIYINFKVYGGRKSSTEGIDLEFDKDDIRYLVSIKSGPNWGNSSQIKKLKDNFNKAQRILRTSQAGVNIRAINGCCYGRDNNPDKGTYEKLCGQRFWSLISGIDTLYVEIIEPLDKRAKEENDAFQKEYAKVINKFTELFISEFCNDGEINWAKLVKYNSSKAKPWKVNL